MNEDTTDLKNIKEKEKIKEKDVKEERIRAITQLYYSNPNVINALVKFASNREVVPRYYEGFGKRPDAIQYPSDIAGLVRKGATSFHSSEEIWDNPLDINSDMTPNEFNHKRKSWDLLIDIDCPYLDYAKNACKIIINFLEEYGINNYGIKFSGSKGFHIIVSGEAFPKEYDGMKMNESFPDWPRAICEYIMQKVKPAFNRSLGSKDASEISKRKNISEEEIVEVSCPNCGEPAKKGVLVKLECPVCGDSIERRESSLKNKRLKCTKKNCPGIFEVITSREMYYCEKCKINNISSMKGIEDETSGTLVLSKHGRSINKEEVTFEKGIKEEYTGSLDLVLVASRHLFRMPYSLHEKTSLASVVLTKDEIDNFDPKDASPMKVKIREYMPNNFEGEAKKLLMDALAWKKSQTNEEDKKIKEKYYTYEHKDVDNSQITEAMFPQAIKKLLLGLDDGKKRGLFVLLTFLRSLNFSPEYINKKVREWNEKNNNPLKEGYIRSQIDWHLRQKKKILPPNYDNASFYKDLGLIDKKQETKNPLVDVMKNVRKNSNN